MFHACTSRSSSTSRLFFVLLGAAACALAVALALAGPPSARSRDDARSSQGQRVLDGVPVGRLTGADLARVADVIDHMSLDDEITMVEGHGTAPPNPYVFYMPGIPDLCIPQLGEEDGPAGSPTSSPTSPSCRPASGSPPPSTRRWRASTAR